MTRVATGGESGQDTRGVESQLDDLPPDAARRVRLTISCTDADDLPKVPNAGEVIERDGRRLQIMHNGLVVEEGCYYGPWMTEIIRGKRGHHEPQEELVFQRVIERLAADSADGADGADSAVPTMIEFGSFWTYYGMWFAHQFPAGRVVAMEPDPAYLDVGRRNWALNHLEAHVDFVQGAVGAQPGQVLDFRAESDGHAYPVVQRDLRSLMVEYGLNRVDLVLSDIQGAESILLDRARDQFAAGQVRFLIVSTHHHSISGNPMTHMQALDTLVGAGAHVIAEHSVSESFSGDGLIAVSFDDRDKDLSIPVSHARAQESLFGGLEPDLNHAWQQLHVAEREADELRRRLADGEAAHAAADAGRATAQAELAAIYRTKLLRLSRRPRELYRRLRLRRR